MTEKIGLIKNPLTIIAIFAGIAEVSGTIVLPFIAENNQVLFIYFLILFPSILVILFFVTLNFNNRVLYAPSDDKDEQNYIKINRYDLSSQRNVEVKVLKNDAVDPQYISITEKLEVLNNQIIKLEANRPRIGETEFIKKNIQGEFLVSNFSNAPGFLRMMASKGYDFEIYLSPGRRAEKNVDLKEFYDFARFKAFWLGTLVPVESAKEIITLAKEFYPHLEYIHLAGDHKTGGQRANLYIGGATETAEKRYGLRKLSDEDFQKIKSLNTETDLHSFVRSFY